MAIDLLGLKISTNTWVDCMFPLVLRHKFFCFSSTRHCHFVALGKKQIVTEFEAQYASFTNGPAFYSVSFASASDSHNLFLNPLRWRSELVSDCSSVCPPYVLCSSWLTATFLQHSLVSLPVALVFSVAISPISLALVAVFLSMYVPLILLLLTFSRTMLYRH